MAERFEQNEQIRGLFHKRMYQMNLARRQAQIRRAREQHPIAGTVLSPLINLVLVHEDTKKEERGDRGEQQVAKTIASLPAPWCYLNDVVLEYRAGKMMQVDHIAVGPNAVVVIETKNWRGPIKGQHDRFQIRNDRGWNTINKSPTKQAVWHADVLRRYLEAHGFQVSVVPVVVFIRPDWLRADACGCVVLNGPRELLRYLHQMHTPGADDTCREIATLISGSFALYGTSGAGMSAATGAAPSSLPTGKSSLPTPKTPMVGAGPLNPSPLPPTNQAPVADTDIATSDLATEKQINYARVLLHRAGRQYSEDRLQHLTRSEVQAVIDRLRFHRDVPLPPGLVV